MVAYMAGVKTGRRNSDTRASIMGNSKLISTMVPFKKANLMKLVVVNVIPLFGNITLPFPLSNRNCKIRSTASLSCTQGLIHS